MPKPTPTGRQDATAGEGATAEVSSPAGESVIIKKGDTAEATASKGPASIAADSANELFDTKISLPVAASHSSSTVSGNVSHKRKSNMESTSLPKKLRSTQLTSTCAASALVTSEVREAVNVKRKYSAAIRGTPAADEHLQKQFIMSKIQKVRERMNAARTTLMGEELYRAVADKEIGEVRRLLDAGADVNYINIYGSTPLQRALFDPREDVVELLLERGADANAINEIGISAMHLVAGNNCSKRCMDQLLSTGADVNARSETGVTPLHTAADWNNGMAVRALLSAGARNDLKAWGGPWDNRTPAELTTSPEIRELLRL